MQIGDVTAMHHIEPVEMTDQQPTEQPAEREAELEADTAGA